VRDTRIVDINPSAQALTTLYPGAEVIDAHERIVLPGFVNSHFHGESLLLKHITGRSPYISWKTLPGFSSAAGRLLDPLAASDIAALYGLSAYMHLRCGTTAVGDYPAHYSPGILQQIITRVAGAGLRTVTALQSWEQVDGFRSSSSSARQFSISLGPEIGFTVYSFETLARASSEMQFPLVAHLGEVRADVEALRARFKKNPLRVLKDSGVLLPSTHLIHCNHIPDGDLALLNDGGNAVTLCVRSALAKQTGYPLLRALASHDIPLCLGTDWGETDMLGEISVLRNLPRYLPAVAHYTPLELIRMGTINGAHALGIASQTGSLEVGKHADLVMIPFNDIRLPALGAHPSAEEVAQVLTDFCTTGMISDVMTGGVFRVKNGFPVGAEEGEMLRDMRRLTRAFLPASTADRRGERAPGIPLLPAERGEKSTLAEGGEGGVQREPGANLRPPGPSPEQPQQKPPPAMKKITKVFGEDDL
jgi:5-methylthioadenosine/S-adenosylhomocysteine deaminase